MPCRAGREKWGTEVALWLPPLPARHTQTHIHTHTHVCVCTLRAPAAVVASGLRSRREARRSRQRHGQRSPLLFSALMAVLFPRKHCTLATCS